MRVQSISTNYYQKQVNYRKNQPMNFTSKLDLEDFEKPIEQMNTVICAKVMNTLSEKIPKLKKAFANFGIEGDVTPDSLTKIMDNIFTDSGNLTTQSIKDFKTNKGVNTIQDFLTYMEKNITDAM